MRLAKRYLQDRFLPDSAIDLLDEAAAAKRVEFDGVPAAVDEAIRRVEGLRAQLASLQHTDDAPTLEARTRIDAELQELAPRAQQIRSKLESRRGAIAAVRTLRSELDDARTTRDRYREQQDYARLGELDHVTIPDLESRLAKSVAFGPDMHSMARLRAFGGDYEIRSALDRLSAKPFARGGRDVTQRVATGSVTSTSVVVAMAAPTGRHLHG